MKHNIYHACDIRGIADRDLDDATVTDIARALGVMLTRKNRGGRRGYSLVYAALEADFVSGTGCFRLSGAGYWVRWRRRYFIMRCVKAKPKAAL